MMPESEGRNEQKTVCFCFLIGGLITQIVPFIIVRKMARHVLHCGCSQ
jgi:hypothetical protein